MKETLIERLKGCRENFRNAVREKDWRDANYWEGRGDAYRDLLFDLYDWDEGKEG